MALLRVVCLYWFPENNQMLHMFCDQALIAFWKERDGGLGRIFSGGGLEAISLIW